MTEREYTSELMFLGKDPCTILHSQYTFSVLVQLRGRNSEQERSGAVFKEVHRVYTYCAALRTRVPPTASGKQSRPVQSSLRLAKLTHICVLGLCTKVTVFFSSEGGKFCIWTGTFQFRFGISVWYSILCRYTLPQLFPPLC